MQEPKIGRNEPCPCGSRRKYKRCCGATAPPIAAPSVVADLYDGFALEWLTVNQGPKRSTLTLDELATASKAKPRSSRIPNAKAAEYFRIEETLLRDSPRISLRVGSIPEGPAWSLDFKFKTLLNFPFRVLWTTDGSAALQFAGRPDTEDEAKFDRALSITIFVLESLLAGEYPWTEECATSPEFDAEMGNLSTRLRAECPRFFSKLFLPAMEAGAATEPPELEWVYWMDLRFAAAGRAALPDEDVSARAPSPRRPKLSEKFLADLPPGLDYRSETVFEFPSLSGKGTSLLDEVHLKLTNFPAASLREIFSNWEVAALLEKWPAERLPRISQLSPAWQSTQWLNIGRMPSYLPEYREAASLGERAILGWLERLIDMEIPVCLGASSPKGRRTKTVARLRKIELDGDLRTGIQLLPDETPWSTAALSLPAQSPENLHRLYSQESGVLNFDSASGTLRLSAQSAVDLCVHSIAWRRDPVIHGHRAISEIFSELEDFSRRTGVPLADVPPRVAVVPRPELWFERDGTLALSFRVPPSIEEGRPEGFRAWNFPYAFLPLLRGFVEGPQALLTRKASELAQKKQGPKRRRDLRAIRHAGLFAMLFAERASFAARGTDLADTPVRSRKDLEAELDRRLTAFVGDATDPAESRDKSSCSPAIKQLLASIGDPELGPLPSKVAVYYLGREFFLEGVREPVFAFLRALVRYRALLTGGAPFLKTRGLDLVSPEDLSRLSARSGYGVTPLSESTQGSLAAHVVRFDLRTPADPGGALLRAELFALETQGFDFYWEGKRTELLDAADLRLVLDVRDGPDKESTNPLDWFALQPEVFLRGQKVAPETWSQGSREGMLEYEGTLYRIPVKLLPSLKRLESFWERISGKGGASSSTRSAGTFHPLPRAEALEVLSMMDSQIEISGNDRFSEIHRAFQRLDAPSKKTTKIKGLEGNLKDYQFAGVQWLSDLHSIGLGGVLADDMGLGKTVQVLAFLARLRQEKRLRPNHRVLIVVPTSLVGNWLHEAATFVPDLQISALHPRQGLPEPGGISVTTYGLLGDHPDFFAGADWEIAIFDEAQNLKNLSAVRTTAARRVGARYKFALTGTPLENHFGEFFSILDLCAPGGLGDFAAYQKRFVYPDTIRAADLDILRRKIKPLLLRRVKDQVLSEFPEKFENRVGLDFDPEQRKLYRDTALSWSGRVRESVESLGESKSQILMLTALLRLRQICSDPSVIDGVRYARTPPKIEWLVEKAAERIAEGESILVFGQFIGSLERALSAFERAGVPAELMTGATSGKKRTEMIDRFQKGTESRALLMTLKTGGVGLNLTRANHVFHIDPWWNPAVEDQATARAHRLGQGRTVQVHRLLMNHSVEEKIELLKLRKRKSFDQLLGAAVEEELGAAATASVRTGGISRTDFEYLIADWK